MSGEPSIVTRVSGAIEAIDVPAVEDGAIAALHIVRNPDKVIYIGRQLAAH